MQLALLPRRCPRAGRASRLAGGRAGGATWGRQPASSSQQQQQLLCAGTLRCFSSSDWGANRLELWEEKRRNRDDHAARWRRKDRQGWTDENFESREAAREVSHLGRQRRWEEALSAFARVEEKGPWLRAAAMNACAKAHQFGIAEQIFKESPDKTVDTYTMMMSICGRINPDKADGLMQEMSQGSLTPDAAAYGSLINVHGKAHNVARALTLFEEMPGRGLQPTAVTYQVVLSACTRAGDKDKAEAIIAQMQAAGIPPDAGHLNSLVASCARSKDEARGREAFKKIRELGIKPDVITYTSLLGTLSGLDAVQKADALVQEMRGEGLEPDSFMYNALLRVAVESQAPDRFNAYLAEMDAKGLERNRETQLRQRELQSLLQAQGYAARGGEEGRGGEGRGEGREQPPGQGPAVAPQDPELPLPEGWQAALDPSTGRSYYWIVSDPAGTTTWERPTARGTA